MAQLPFFIEKKVTGWYTDTMFFKNNLPFVSGIVFIFLFLAVAILFPHSPNTSNTSKAEDTSYWFILHRKSNKEELFKGKPGDKAKSKLIKTFDVKVGIPGQSPTPLPSLLEKEYWLIIKKEDSSDNPETAPYFLTLNIDAPSDWPYGPVSYLECSGMQCDWGKPGYFGLHGVAGDLSRVSEDDLGSSGCIRHTDEDITYLYNLLNPESQEIRYYVEDN